MSKSGRMFLEQQEKGLLEDDSYTDEAYERYIHEKNHPLLDAFGITESIENLKEQTKKKPNHEKF